MRGELAEVHRKQIKQARKFLQKSDLAMHIGSVAIAIEALESILVEKQVLQPDQLMEKIRVLTQEHYAKGEFMPVTED
jgi:hypothetical protein